MGTILEGLMEAVKLLLHGDSEVLEITLRTLQVAGTSTLISVLLGVPLGTLVALKRFPGRKGVITLINLGMGLPPVAVGLITWLCLARYGPLGNLDLLYTPTAMVIAQALIATPLVAGFSIAAIQSINPKMHLQILALGANRLQYLWLLLREAWLGLLAAVIAGFGGVISEVGASMMVGGNIKGETRVLTTAISLEVSKGSLELATALSVILLLLSLAITAVLTLLQQRRRQPQ
ncbi:ABC transporter permease [Brevibacillus ginsengisoli]|uniref:ABC transporter permease n=1 Tax=Brevibacillus ginsengisoli TaxID=363854 RepID=UPI003CF850CA